MFHLANSDVRRFSAKSARIILFASLALLPCESSRVCAQQTQVSAGCFMLKVYKDSTRLSSPQSVRLYSVSKRWDVEQNNGRFCVPQEAAGESMLDITFRVGPERFSIPSLVVGRFSGIWNLYFGGREFARLHGLPKTSKASTSCMVEFDDGEPGIGLVLSPCHERESAAGGPGAGRSERNH